MMMEGGIPDELIELLESLSEEALDDAGRERLQAILGDRPDLLPVVSAHLAVGQALTQLHQDGGDFASRTVAHVAKVAQEGAFGFPEKLRRRILLRRVGIGLAAAAVLMLAAVPWLRRQGAARPVATVVALPPELGSLVDLDGEGREGPEQPFHAGQRVERASGLMRLDFDNGAVVAIEAPAVVTVISGSELLLESGRLNAWCTESAHGFKVRTAATTVTDLGTAFGVTAKADGGSDVLVLNGLVEVENGGGKLRVPQGEAVSARDDADLKRVAFDASGFRKTWPLACGILSTRGEVIPADPDVPERLVQMEDNEHVLVLPEKREVPFTQPIHAEVISPGTLPGNITGDIWTLNPVKGKRLSSFLIRYNPVGSFSEDKFLCFRGEVTFDRPVYAIAAQAQALKDTDPIFATCAWPDDPYRGIELQQIMNPPDSVTLSADRRTVKVVFYAGRSTDDVRVILDDDD